MRRGRVGRKVNGFGTRLGNRAVRDVGIERIGCVSYSQSTLPGKIGNVLVLVYQGLRERQLCIADYLEAAGIIERNNQGQKGKGGEGHRHELAHG